MESRGRSAQLCEELESRLGAVERWGPGLTTGNYLIKQQLLEDETVVFVKNELTRMKNSLNPEFSELSESPNEDEEERSRREAFLKLTVHFLNKMNQKELAACLLSKNPHPHFGSKLKSDIKKKLQPVFEGISKARNSSSLNQIYTELYITEGRSGEVNNKHEGRHTERNVSKGETTIRCEDMFKTSTARDKPIRTVLTKGVAGIGKTFLTHKFTLDWAEGKANQDIKLIFPLTQIIKEERGLYQETVFCFIQPSVQEFLAALHVHLTFTNSGINLLEEEEPASKQAEESLAIHFYQSAVDKALQSPNGHLDLFLRFLLGLSMQTNQTLLQGLH